MKLGAAEVLDPDKECKSKSLQVCWLRSFVCLSVPSYLKRPHLCLAVQLYTLPAACIVSLVN